MPRPPFQPTYRASAHAFPMPDAKTRKKVARSHFTIANILKNGTLIVALCALNQLGAPGGVMFYCILAVWAMMGTESALKALTVSFFALITNEAIVPKNLAFGPGRIIIIFIAFGRIFYDAWRAGFPFSQQKHLIALWAFGFVCGVLAFINQYFVTISLLKIFLFSLGVSSLLVSAERLKRGSSDMTCWFFTLIVLTVAIGLATIPLGIGYNFRGDFVTVVWFNGPFWHSQTLGPVAAMMVSYLFCIFQFTPYRLRWLSIPLALVLFYFIYLTGSRTALLGMMLGLAAIGAGIYLIRDNRFRRVRQNVSKPMLLVGGISFVLIVVLADFFTGNRIGSRASEFILKQTSSSFAYADSDIALDNVMASRQFLIDMQLHNFQRSPLTGIGFGTALTAEFAESATLVSAPTEKGFIPTAILEETGLIGTLFFLIFLGCIFAYFIRDKNMPGQGMFITLLATNLGEMTFFSLGGTGSFLWLLVAGGILLGDRCVIVQQPNRPKPRPL